MAYVRKKIAWKDYLKYTVYLPKETHKLLLYNNWTCDSDNIKLQYYVEEWCEENVGYTSLSDWHKDRWHPEKPKWYFECRIENIRYQRRRIIGVVRFFEIEDAMAFKLRWF